MVDQVVEMVTVFVVVIIHELGHWAVARFFQWKIEAITLLPFGAVMHVEDAEIKPMHEGLLVALAGPLMNGVLAIFAGLMGWLQWWNLEWAQFFMLSNLIIATFNLLPIYPLDGSRIYLCIRSYYFPYWSILKERIIISVILTLSGIALMLFILPPSFGWLLVLGFLLQQNWWKWRQRPYDFLRFLFHRYVANAREYPIRLELLAEDETVWLALQRLCLYRYHLYHMAKHPGEFVTESRFLHGFVIKRQPQRAAIHFFRYNR